MEPEVVVEHEHKKIAIAICYVFISLCLFFLRNVPVLTEVLFHNVCNK